MRTLHIIMPMAGEGSRFVKEGYTCPKPLICVDNTPLFIKAINSVNNIKCPVKYSFIVRKEHIESFNIDIQIKKYFPDAIIYTVDKTTRGAVETCLIAQEKIENEEGILIIDCDLEFHSTEYNQRIENLLYQENSSGGALLSFKSNDPRYSYALTSNNNIVIQTAEKKVISPNALIGAYFFASANSFLLAANQLLQDGIRGNSEFYVSLLYNYLIKNKETIYLCSSDYYHSYGTPEELNHNINKE